MQRKWLYCFLILVFSLSLFGCKKDDQMYTDLKKVDDYLYEINYNDYRYDINLETITNVEDFGCSSVRNGNYYGRNFDFIFNDVPEFVVKVKKTKNRHASIGISINSSIHASDNITDGYIEKLELLPNFTLDGINDAGVICSDNVVPNTDVEKVTGTNPSGENLHMGFIVRYVLDNASSADEAIELLKKRNIYGNLGEHYNLHFMIADKNKTYTVEFIDNKLVAEEKKGQEQVMTNYYVNLDHLTENAAGIERSKILKDNYNEGNSFEGMWNLLKRVRYSNAYLYNNAIEWYSDFAPQSILNSNDQSELNKIKETIQDVKNGYWVSRTYEKRNPSNMIYWITTHNSTYDIANKKLRLTIQENYDKYFEYKLDD